MMMPSQPFPEAKLAWMIWQTLETLNSLLWDRYEKDFLSFAMEEENRHSEPIP
jgi:hypothetical protein